MHSVTASTFSVLTGLGQSGHPTFFAKYNLSNSIKLAQLYSGSMMLKKEPKDMDPYTDVIVDDIMSNDDLWRTLQQKLST